MKSEIPGNASKQVSRLSVLSMHQMWRCWDVVERSVKLYLRSWLEFFYSSCFNPHCTVWRRVYRTCDGLIHSENLLKLQKISSSRYSQFQRKCGLQFALIALIWHRILLFFSESASHYGRPVRVTDQYDILRPSRLVRNSAWNKNNVDSISFLCIRYLMPQLHSMTSITKKIHAVLYSLY